MRSLLLLLVGVLVLLVSSPAQRAPRQFHVTGQQLPASLTSPAALEGGTTNTDVNIDWLITANTGSSTRHITVSDCTATTPFLFYNAYPIPALTTWSVPLGSARFRGCFKWSADSTDVMGTVLGTR